ncbi:MAG: hypothetical protein ABI656_01455, partial [bacterium]
MNAIIRFTSTCVCALAYTSTYFEALKFYAQDTMRVWKETPVHQRKKAVQLLTERLCAGTGCLQCVRIYCI